jgi:hypothetical protein
MKHSPWSSRLRVRCGANNPTLEKFTVTKPPENQARRNQPRRGTGQEPTEKGQGGGQDPHKAVGPGKGEEEGGG